MQMDISSSTRLGPGSLMRSPKCGYWLRGEEEFRTELQKHRRLQVGRRQTSERNEEGTVRDLEQHGKGFCFGIQEVREFSERKGETLSNATGRSDKIKEAIHGHST